MHPPYHTPTGSGPAALHRTRLIEEIAYLEARLQEVGQTGDCAYENALVRQYVELIREHRRALAGDSDGV